MKNRKLQNLIGGLVLAVTLGVALAGGEAVAHAAELSDYVQIMDEQAAVVLDDNDTGEDVSEDVSDKESQSGGEDSSEDNSSEDNSSEGNSSENNSSDAGEEQDPNYILQNGRLVDEETGVAFSETGFAKSGEVYYYVVNGTWASSSTGIIKVENVENAKDEWWYVKNGIADFTLNSVEKNASGWWYIKNGKVDFTYSGVAHNANGWWRIENGKVNFNFTGFAKNENGWWYLTGGKVRFDKYDVIKGTVNGKTGWWYVRGSKVIFETTVAKNANGWWYCENGMVNFKYTGFAKNANGWWYCEGGKVTFKMNSVKKGTVNGESGWWYVVGSKVSFTNTVAKNENGWWCIENGKVNFECNSIDKNENGWWKIKNGKVDFSFTGLAKNKNGWWYCENGKVNFDVTSVIKGTVNGESGWWYVQGGKVNLSYNGVGVNANGAWLIENGKVNFDFTGTKTFNGLTYTFTNGRTYDHIDGWQTISGVSYYYKNGVRLTNCVADGYKLDASGQSETRKLVLEIVNQHTNNAMSNEAKISALWNWLIYNNWTYARNNEHVASTWVWYDGWTDDYAKQCIQNQSGNCFRYAALFGYLVKEATGYEVRVYHGDTTAVRGGTMPHGWITVKIDGTEYAYDPDLAKFESKSNSAYYKTPYSQTSKSFHLNGVATNLY